MSVCACGVSAVICASAGAYAASGQPSLRDGITLAAVSIPSTPTARTENAPSAQNLKLRDGRLSQVRLAEAQQQDMQQRDIEKRLPSTPETRAPAEQTVLPGKPAQLRDVDLNPFVLSSVRINGASVFSPDAFAEHYDQYLARSITLQDVLAITDALTNMYRNRGYFLSRATVPPQSAENGTLEIEIVEGFLTDIVYEGDVPASIRRRFDPLLASKPLDLDLVQRTATLVNDLPGVTITRFAFEPDPDDLAKHRLIVAVDVDRLEARVYVDNRGVSAASEVQTYTSVAANSLLKAGDQLRVGLFTVPDEPSAFIIGDASYQIPLSRNGTYVTFSGAVSRFEAGASLTAINTETTTKRISVEFSHPLIRTTKKALWVNVGFEGRDIEEEQLGAPVFMDKVRVIHGSMNYRQTHGGGKTALYAEARHGIDMFGDGATTAPLSRPDADGQFFKLQGELSRYQDIGEVFGLYAAVSGQYSLDPLLASDEFAIGGARFGRAYDYAEVTGENGVAGLVELRFGKDPGIGAIDFFQLYGFYDHGAVWNEGVAGALTLSSAGGGIRLTLPESIYATVEAARPLDRTPFTQGDRDWRAFFSVSKDF